MTPPVVMWFRQDLRLADNAAFAAATAAGPVLCVYILDDETPGEWRWGSASRWWLHKSLESLSRDLAARGATLILRSGAADKVIEQVIMETGTQAIHFTRDYAPWSGALEQRVKTTAQARGASCKRFGGYLLHEPEVIRTGQGEPYKVYTPFARACLAAGEPKPPRPGPSQFAAWMGKLGSDRLADWDLLPKRPNWAKGFTEIWTPGEAGARARLDAFIEDGLTNYADTRDRPDHCDVAAVAASALG